MPLPQARLDRNPDRWEAEWQEHFARLEKWRQGSGFSHTREDIRLRVHVYIHQPYIDVYFALSEQWDASISRSIDPQLHKQLRLVLKRTYFMSIAVEAILQSFNMLPLPSVLPMKKKKSEGMDRASLFASIRTRDAEGLHAKPLGSPDKPCTHCHARSGGKSAGDFRVPGTAPGEPFKACSRCAAAGHTVRYCSRACQIADWKGGDPPHRLTCGKPPSVPKSPAPLPPGARELWSEILQVAEEPFHRDLQPGPALRHTMLTLSAYPEWDYLFTLPSGKAVPVILPSENEEAKTSLHRTRASAFMEGNTACLGRLYELLEPHARLHSSAGFDAEALKMQLEQEYNVNIEEARDNNRTWSGICGICVGD